MSAVVEYKGILAYGYGTACMDDGKMIYGYFPGNEYFINDLRYYPKVERFFYEEVVENFKTQERNYNFENAVISISCQMVSRAAYPLMKIFVGARRDYTDFQRSKKSNKDKKKIAPEDEVYYFVDAGQMTPTEINFTYNPALSLERNLQEKSDLTAQASESSMFKNITAYERHIFHFASRTRQDHRLPEGLMFKQPRGRRFDMSYLNLYILSQEEYLDIELSVREYFAENLSKSIELQELMGLSNKIYYEYIPKVISVIEQNPTAIRNAEGLLKLMRENFVQERHLGIIADNMNVPHVRAIAVEYMLAKCISKIIGYHFVDKFIEVVLD